MSVRRSRPEKDAEFLDRLQQVLGFPIMPWQKKVICDMRAAIEGGRPLGMCICPPGRHGTVVGTHKPGCPQRSK